MAVERATRTWLPVAAWSAVATTLLLVQAHARGSPSQWWPPSADTLGGWVQFDGPEYLAIAADGYTRRQLVWFPVYPLLVRGVHAVYGDWATAGVVVSLAAGLVAASLFWRWLAAVGVDATARTTALAVLLLYPYGWFQYGVVYSDALFLALALGAFSLVEREHLVSAGLVGAVATATRPSGFAVAIGITVVALERAGALVVADGATGWRAALGIPTSLRFDRMRAALLGPSLAWLGLVAYCAYQAVQWGSPSRFVSEQANYHDTGTASTFLKQQYFDAWYQGFDGRHLATTTAQAVLLAVVLMTVPAVGRRFGWGYAAFVGALAVFPAVSVSTFMGIGRYLLPAFPCFALAGGWLAKRPVLRVVWLLASATALLVMARGFARSWYLT